MSGSYRIDHDLQLLIVELTGETCFAEVEEVLARIAREVEERFDVLVDLSGITRSTVTPGQTKDLARHPRHESPVHVAFIATLPDVYGRARAYQQVYEAQAGGSNVGVFHTKTDALEWLGRGPNGPKLPSRS
jgi:hypothetical protein